MVDLFYDADCERGNGAYTSSKSLVRIFFCGNELMIRCGRPRKEVSIPQKDILHMNDVNWLNTFPRVSAGPLCVILRTFLHSREVLSCLAKYCPDVEILLQIVSR